MNTVTPSTGNLYLVVGYDGSPPDHRRADQGGGEGPGRPPRRQRSDRGRELIAGHAPTGRLAGRGFHAVPGHVGGGLPDREPQLYPPGYLYFGAWDARGVSPLRASRTTQVGASGSCVGISSATAVYHTCLRGLFLSEGAYGGALSAIHTGG